MINESAVNKIINEEISKGEKEKMKRNNKDGFTPMLST